MDMEKELKRACSLLSEKLAKTESAPRTPEVLMELHSMRCPSETREYLSVEYMLKHGYSTIN